MQTLSYTIPQEVKKNIDNFNVKSILLAKAWEVFNDNNVRQVLIFKQSGDLIVSTDGVVSNGSWSYMLENKAIIISTDTGSFLFHPDYYDKVVLSLKRDGCEESLFLMDSNTAQTRTQQRNSDDLESYFNALIDKYIYEKSVIEARLASIEEAEKRVKGTTGRISKVIVIFYLVFLILVGLSSFLIVLNYDLDLNFGQTYLVVLALFIICLPFLFFTKYVDSCLKSREIALMHLQKTDIHLYNLAEQEKSIPVIIRVAGYYMGLLSTIISLIIIAIKDAFPDTIWGLFGMCIGCCLGTLFWIGMGAIIAREKEKKLFGMKLSFKSYRPFD